MLIYPQTKSKKNPSDILKEINKKISSQAKRLKNSLAIGSDTKIDFTSLNTLYCLRDVYNSKINNADWLCNFSMDQIIYAIRKELRKSC